MTADSFTCAEDGFVLRAPVTEVRELDGCLAVVITDPGNAGQHMREAHPELWAEMCDLRRRMNASGRYGLPRKVDGSFLRPGEDVADCA